MRSDYPIEWLAELKARNNIVEVISGYCQVEKAGSLHKACCPFHSEKTPSLVIYEDGGNYYCYGCHASGDVITFIREIENLTFPEAVKLLADRVGMEVPHVEYSVEQKKEKEDREVIFDILTETARYYHDNLVNRPEAAEARKYLSNRGIGRDIIERYGLGYSLDFDRLPNHLRLKGFPESLIEKSGVLTKEKKKDFLSRRIIVPIINPYDKVVGFGGRVVGKPEEGSPKYLNLTGTPVFSKKTLFYGLNYVRKLRRTLETDYLLLVEGYMDVISLGNVGILNAVASMGTAFSIEKANELARWTQRVVVCFDGDNAGKKATLSAIDVLNDAGIDVRVVSLPDEMDPDDFAAKYGKDAFLKLIESAPDRIEYCLSLIENTSDLKTASGRAYYMKRCIEYLAKQKSIALQEVYLPLIADKSIVSVDALRSQLRKSLIAKPVTSTKPVDDAVQEYSPALISAAEFVLAALIGNKKYANYTAVRAKWFFTDLYKRVFEYVVSEIERGAQPRANKVYDYVDESDEVSRIINFAIPTKSEVECLHYFEDSLCVLANNYIDGQIASEKKVLATALDKPTRDNAIRNIQKLQLARKSTALADKYL